MAQSVKVLEEKISKMKKIVYKTLVDPSTVKLIGEKKRGKLFAKMGFLRQKPEDVQFESLEKFYDPFFILNGRYLIDYYRKRIYKLDVEEEVSEIVIFNQVLKPKTPSLAKFRRKGKEVELKADQRIIKENSNYMVLDRKGREIKVEEFPPAPSEEEPEKVLAEAGDRVWKLEVSPERAIEIFRSKVVDRPQDVERINIELFEVSDRTIVYVPVYRATYRNVKTGEKKTILVNGITSKLVEKTETQ